MRPLVRVAAAVAILGGIVGAWFLCTQSARSREFDARVRFSVPLTGASGTAGFTIDCSKWPARKGNCQLTLANLGNPADVSDSAAPEHERDSSDALLHEAVWRDDESRQRLANESRPLLLRMRIQAIDSAGQVANRIDYGTPDDDGWIELALLGWPIRAFHPIGRLQPDGSTSTHIEVELVRGPPIPAGVVPVIVADGENGSDLLESASVGFAIVNAAFALLVPLAAYLALVAWSNKQRAAEISEINRLVRR